MPVEKKVLFNFHNADLIDNLLKQIAEVEHRSKSSVAESILLDSFLPKNPIIRNIIQKPLADDEPIENIIGLLFKYFASCAEDDMKVDVSSLIQFVIRQVPLMYSLNIKAKYKIKKMFRT